MRYARFETTENRDQDRNIISKTTSVVEIIDEADGFTIGQMFHPDFVANLEKVADDVSIGWVKNGSKLAPPASEPAQ